jgi:hypothetical protein
MAVDRDLLNLYRQTQEHLNKVVLVALRRVGK